MAALIGDAEMIAGLSEDGRGRFARVGGILDSALAARGHATLSARVRGAWLALAGPATLDDPIDLDAAELYFATLSMHEVAGDVPDWAGFIAALAELRAAPQAVAAARVQVMTLHRAKGLEFDVVIMPGLARAPNRRDAPLIRWRRRPAGLLLAPMKERGGNADPVYAYLKHLSDGEEHAELARLLYVGCTRARRRLHLIAELSVSENDEGTVEWKPPRSGSALARFGNAIDAMLPPAAAAPAPATTPPSPPMLLRVPAAWSAPPLPSGVPARAEIDTARELLPFDWARETAKHVGTIAHRLFAQIGREGLAAWTAERVSHLSPRIRRELAAAGVDAAELAGRHRAGRGRRDAAPRRSARALAVRAGAHGRPQRVGAGRHRRRRDRSRRPRSDVRRRRRALHRGFQDERPRRRRHRSISRPRGRPLSRTSSRVTRLS